MFEDAAVFSGYSVNNLEAARTFYADVLGLNIADQPGMGFDIQWPSGHHLFIYEKPEHVPAGFTVLNFPVENIDDAIHKLNDKGVEMKRYDNLPAPQDELGVLRGLSSGYGPDIAWFTDPAGNVLSVLQDK